MSKKKFPSISKFDEGIKAEFAPDGLFSAPQSGNIEERFSIYATGYGARTRDSMEEVYEALSQLLGEERWLELGGLYTAAYPSKSYNLADVGFYLPQFMRDIEFESKWISMAEFELLIWKSFHAKRSVPAGLDDFTKVSEDTRFEFRPSTFLFKADFRCAAAWLDRENSDVEAGNEYAVVYRESFTTKVEIISAQEFELLRRLADGHSLGEAMNRLSFEPSQDNFSWWLKSWCDRQYFSKLRRDS